MAAASESSIRILLAEDSKLVVEQVRDLVASMSVDAELRVAERHDDAISVAKSFKPHIAVLDLQLKGGTGFDVLRELRNCEAKPLFIVHTNHAMPEYRRHALRNGVAHFLDKCDVDKLKLVIEQYARDQCLGTPVD